MPKKIIITVPDDMPTEAIIEYLEVVAEQIEEGYLSGHVKPDHHWTSEGRIS